MDIIERTRELGKEIQKDERYLKFRLAAQAAEEDGALQDLLGAYNRGRLALQSELQKPQEERDDGKIQTYRQQLNAGYFAVMKNPRMAAYNRARAGLDLLMRRMTAILEKSAAGEDPETADYTAPACGGDCASCAGCR